MFALVDCNNFYASCERVFNPSLNGKPVVVLSNNDGCVIARSQEAKLLQIPMGAVAYKWEEFFRKNDVVVYSSNYTLYGDLSSRVSKTLSDFAADMEVYSIDESFLDFRGMKIEDFKEYGITIRKKVLKYVGIPVSVGIANTKTLAKVANHTGKKNKEYGGVCIIDSDAKRVELLKKFPVGDIWGVGRQYAKLLAKFGVVTAWDFTLLPDGFVRKHMTVVGLRTKHELMGIPCIEMELEQSDKKNICTSRSFGTPITEYHLMEEAVATYATRCALKLRNQNSFATALMVFIHTNQFNKQDKQYAANRVVQLPSPANSSIILCRYAQIALKSIYREGYRYKKAGVIVLDIVPENPHQTNLFDETDYEKQKLAMKVMDSLNVKYGRDTLKLATQGSGKRWKLKQEKLSPCYTTRWTDIFVVKNI